MTHRAVEVLSHASLVLCEDTRHSRALLDHYHIGTRCSPLHEHNEAKEVPRLLELLGTGDDLALISDAGTPLLSDPGERLVRAAIEAGIAVVPVPGPSAVLAALVASGLGGGTFTFLGFLARKGRERASQLEMLSALPHTGVVYEASNRAADTMADLRAVLGPEAASRRVVVAREITKKFEEFRRGTVEEVAADLATSPPRGEVVIVLEGRRVDAPDEEALRQTALALRRAGVTTRDIARSLVQQFGAPRNLAYRVAQEA